MGGENVAFDNAVEPHFGTVLYLSGVTLATLGYGDITPISPLYEAIALGEALIGFAILSLTISYVLGIYRVLHQLSVLGSDLYHQAEDAGDPRSVLISHFPDGHARNLDPHLMSLYRGIIDFAEGVRGYPIVYYFYGRRPYRSMPYAFYMIGGLAVALCWGLPKGHPATQEPWLPALIAGFTTVITQLRQRFVTSRSTQEPPEAVDFAAFVDCLEGREDPSDDWLRRFLNLEHWMRQLARLDDTPLDIKEAYARYTEWLPFAHRADAFVEAVLEDLSRAQRVLPRSRRAAFRSALEADRLAAQRLLSTHERLGWRRSLPNELDHVLSGVGLFPAPVESLHNRSTGYPVDDDRQQDHETSTSAQTISLLGNSSSLRA